MDALSKIKINHFNDCFKLDSKILTVNEESDSDEYLTTVTKSLINKLPRSLAPFPIYTKQNL